jgi:hypothetical protein
MAKKIEETSEPKFPYTTQPLALRRLLTEIPKRPVPPRVTMSTLQSWAVSSSANGRTVIGVLKKLGLLTQSGEPTSSYTEYMKTGSGPGVLGQRIKEVYRVLFENTLAPQSVSPDELLKLFNIHSGGNSDLLRLQRQTFKTLSEFANFESNQDSVKGGVGATPATNGASPENHPLPPIRVDLHIHLPENKTTRDYEAIIQDIAKYIYGRNIEGN